jgi:hypothetical protein
MSYDDLIWSVSASLRVLVRSDGTMIQVIHSALCYSTVSRLMYSNDVIMLQCFIPRLLRCVHAISAESSAFSVQSLPPVAPRQRVHFTFCRRRMDTCARRR